MKKESAFRRMDMVAFILTKNATACCIAQRKNVQIYIFKMNFIYDEFMRFHNEKRKFQIQNGDLNLLSWDVLVYFFEKISRWRNKPLNH